MNKLNRKKLVGSGLYIVLAAGVLAAMTINVVNMFRGESQTDISPVDSNVEGITDDVPQKAPSGNVKLPADNGDIGIVRPPASSSTQSSDTSPDVEPPKPEDTVPAPSFSQYLMPIVEGVMSEYAPDTLRYSETMGDYRVHEGVDINAAEGTEVLAFASGVVKSIENHPFMGVTVSIEHFGGLSSKYSNLSEDVAADLEIGSEVEVGEVIGTVGRTAISEYEQEPHLHFEVFYQGESVDPAVYFHGTK